MASAEDVERGNFLRVGRDIFKVTRKEVVAVGTHSHTKLKIYMEPIDGGGEKNFIFNHKDKVDLLDVERRVGQIISKSDDKITVMDNKSYETIEVEANHSTFEKAYEGGMLFFVTYEGISKALHVDKE